MQMEHYNIIGWCSYCKEEIIAGEAFVVVKNNIYHACETELHDNCYRLVIDELEEKEEE